MAFWSNLTGTSLRLFKIGLAPSLTLDATNLTSNRTLKFPDSNGSSGYVLQTDGAGNLSWVAQTGGGGGSAANLINVRLASTTNVSSLSGVTALDSVTLNNNDVVLLKDQTIGSENGVYLFSTGSGLARHSSMVNASTQPPGLLVTVSEGTVNFDSLWMLTNNGNVTVGSTSLVFKTLDGVVPGIAVHGSATIDFGSTGAQETSIDVTGLSDIQSTSKVWCYVMADDTTSNRTASDHRYLPLLACFTVGNLQTGVGFTIYGRSLQQLTGQYKVRWAYSN